MIYRVGVTYQNLETNLVYPHPRSLATRKRRDAAKALLVRLVRAEVRSIAGLDTAWGSKAINEAIEADMRHGGSIAIADHSRVWYSCSKYV